MGHNELVEATIDKFGRIVVPKSIRKRLGLSPGDRVSIKVEKTAMLVMPVFPKGRLIDDDGLLVYSTGASLSQEMVDRTFDEVRNHTVNRSVEDVD